MTKVITVKSMARAAASPQKPCSARFKIFIDASGVLKETRNLKLQEKENSSSNKVSFQTTFERIFIILL